MDDTIQDINASSEKITAQICNWTDYKANCNICDRSPKTERFSRGKSHSEHYPAHQYFTITVGFLRMLCFIQSIFGVATVIFASRYINQHTTHVCLVETIMFHA